MRSETRSYRTGDRDVVLDLTRDAVEFVAGEGDGLLHVFVPHATAGLAILETGAGSDDDLLAALDDLLPADDRWRHRHGTPGHGRSHVMPALVPPYATLPVLGGRTSVVRRTGVRTATYPGRMDRLVTPPGWPPQVRPPGAPGWERTAVNWLLDICPPEYRDYAVLRRHEVVLARFAVLHVEACQAAARRGVGEARTALRDVAEPGVVEASVQAWQREQARLMGERRAVGLVEEALRGRRFVARL
jgi:thiamine phosphate synthase YjbQ (UPF0047 family)